MGDNMARKAGTASSAGFGDTLDNYFQLTANKTDVRTEVIAGVTTFLTMA
jgi:hypothetical protein